MSWERFVRDTDGARVVCATCGEQVSETWDSREYRRELEAHAWLHRLGER